MKRLITSAILGCLAISAYSQITITQSAMPVSGDTIRYSTANLVGANLYINQKGANQTWDYSKLTSTGQDLYKYQSANKTPYAFYFINQIGLKTADSLGVSTFTFKNIYSFYTKNSTVFKAEGIGYSISGIPLAAKNSDDDEIYQFPLDYNDSDVSTFRFVFSIPGQTTFSYVQVGKRINIVDGWGSITTPFKTYPSVLRVKTILDEVDSVVTQFGKFPIPRKQVIYKFLSADEHIPILEITGTEVASVFTANQIRFRDKFNGLESPFKPRAGYSIDKVKGVVNTDTFKLTNRSVLATNFQWQFTPANSSAKFVSGTSASSQNPRVVFTKAGVYTVSLLASNTFGSDDTSSADLITITDPNSAINQATKTVVAVYPNPASGVLYVQGLLSGTPIQITDNTGRVVLSTTYSQAAIPVSALSPGIYALKYKDANGTGAVLFSKQ